MTDSTDSSENTADPSTEPAYRQLGEDGNPFSDSGSPDAGTGAAGAGATETGTGTDSVPGDQGIDDATQNAPLPDWGPTDGEHGVDTPAQ